MEQECEVMMLYVVSVCMQLMIQLAVTACCCRLVLMINSCGSDLLNVLCWRLVDVNDGLNSSLLTIVLLLAA